MATTHYVWNPVTDSYLMETDGDHQTTRSYTVEPAPYGRVVSQHEAGQTHWLHYDALGSTRQVTDASGTVVGTNLYDAWGVNRESTGTVETPFRWVGERGRYTETSLPSVYVGARRCAPAVGRWLGRDPAAFLDSVQP